MDKINKKEKSPTAVRQAEEKQKNINYNIPKKQKNVNPVFGKIFKAFGFRG